MKIIQAYKKGFTLTASSMTMVLLLYVVTMVAALLVAIPFKIMLNNAIGNSMSLYSLLTDFDYTSYKDFLLHNISISNFLKSQILWFGVFYLLFSIFTTGGILHIIQENQNKFSLAEFLKGCVTYLQSFFGLAILIVFLHFFIAVVIYGLAAMIIGERLSSVRSELEILLIVGISIIAHIFFALLLAIISDYSKIIIVKSDFRKIIPSFGKAVLFSLGKFFSVYSLYIFIALTPILFGILYFIADMKIGMVSSNTIILMTFIQQLIIGIRIFTKVWILAGQYSFYSGSIMLNQEIPEIEITEEAEEWNFDDLKEPNIES